jgi:hypothetical protein
LKEFEIDFYLEWLGRAYRSKSRLLGFGDDKIKVVADFFCVHQDNLSPKFELGERPVPGKELLPKGKVFETLKDEVDDFLKPDRLDESSMLQATDKNVSKKHALPKKLVAAKKNLQQPFDVGQVADVARGVQVKRSLESKMAFASEAHTERHPIKRESRRGKKVEAHALVTEPVEEGYASSLVAEPTAEEDLALNLVAEPPPAEKDYARSLVAEAPAETRHYLDHKRKQPIVDSKRESEAVLQLPAKRPRRFRRSAEPPTEEDHTHSLVAEPPAKTRPYSGHGRKQPIVDYTHENKEVVQLPSKRPQRLRRSAEPPAEEDHALSLVAKPPGNARPHSDHKRNQPIDDSARENEEVVQLPSKRPQRFRRSVLGGDVLGNFYYEDYSKPWKSTQAVNQRERSIEIEATEAQFTPDEKDLPLSLLLSSSKRRESRSKQVTEEGNGSVADALACAKTPDEKNKTLTIGLSEETAHAGADQGITSVNVQGREENISCESSTLVGVTASIAERLSIVDAPEKSPSKRGRQQGKLKAVDSILDDG